MRLEDGDVALRPLVAADAPGLAAAARDPLVARYTSLPADYTERDALAFIRRGGDEFAIVDAESDEILGVVGFLRQGHARGHFGYWVTEKARGRGVATRALRLVADWAVAEYGLARLQLIVEQDNEASIRVAEKAGFRREALLRSYVEVSGARRDVYLYALLPDEHDPRTG